MKKTLGGERLGSGNKMKVDLHGYERSTHDLSYIWRSTMSAGTLVPFLNKVALPGDTWDINLDCDMKTHPTIGPLFGSFKVQLDVFMIPMRLYNAVLHNNKLGIGLEMEKVYLPTVTFAVQQMNDFDDVIDKDNAQINPSSIWAYLGLRGIGYNDDTASAERTFNGISILMYWDIYKQYYSNKMEEIGCVIHSTAELGGTISGGAVVNPLAVSTALPSVLGAYMGDENYYIKLDNQVTNNWPNLETVIFNTSLGEIYALDLANWVRDTVSNNFQRGYFKADKWGQLDVYSYRRAGIYDSFPVIPQVVTFDLNNIDTMREAILTNYSTAAPFDITSYASGASLTPYEYVTEVDASYIRQSQEGLGLKAYQSDLYNNWLKTEYITAINNATKVDTTALGGFTMDQFQLARKVYDLLNRVAVSGGTYLDWVESVYDVDVYNRPESPVYMGGLIKELVFQEVVSNAQTTTQPLATLGGRGVLSKKHKGGEVYIKVTEPAYIMGIISLTPRVDYSQGNEWDLHLQTLNDLHKPQLDGIGFQDLITEQMAWWSTTYNNATAEWVTQSAGKQPAWLNYMTSVNKTFGNFAIGEPVGEMFMTLNRRYEESTGSILDLTTYIDPTKYNNIFAQTSLDAQNFWAQIAVNLTVRRKMSAKLMPNL